LKKKEKDGTSSYGTKKKEEKELFHLTKERRNTRIRTRALIKGEK